jgi:hypothetical protein
MDSSDRNTSFTSGRDRRTTPKPKSRSAVAILSWVTMAQAWEKSAPFNCSAKLLTAWELLKTQTWVGFKNSWTL